MRSSFIKFYDNQLRTKAEYKHCSPPAQFLFHNESSEKFLSDEVAVQRSVDKDRAPGSV